ncbi:MAG: serine/threonine-protein kinase, partial [Planctomycetota bacterium]
VSKRLSLDDESVVRHLRAYQEALEAGERPDRRQMLARFPQIAEELARCLDGLDFVHQVAPQLHDDEEPPDGELRPPTPIGDFRILREVGRGGMGVVYEAEQMSLGRRVALKVLPFAAVLDSRCLRRFKNEAQAAAHLHHTNVVPVHAVGSDRGVHYYAMQFIEGPTLAGIIDELKSFAGNGNGQHRDSSPALQAIATDRTTESPRFCRAVANLGIQAAEALDHAHESGVIHRDIKPPNLIVDGKGHLWITDFGLASTRNDTGLTMTGDIVGTLRYMSPEQVLAKRVPVDHRTDIYSLSITLYELLTLKQAFPGDDPRAVMQEIALKEPTKPRALNPATPPALETVLLKAMSKDPADRYATARELADDLRRFLEDRPIHARRPGLVKRAVQWGRRHRAVVWSATAVLLLTAIGLAVSTVLIERQRRIAVARADEAKTEHARAELNFAKAREAVDSMLARVSDELSDYPHMHHLQKELMERALQLYLDLLDYQGDEPELRADAARTYRRVGVIYKWLARDAESRRAHEQAVALFRALADEFPDDPRYRFEVASSLWYLHQLLVEPERAAAESALRRAVRMLEGLLVADPSDVAYRSWLATCHLSSFELLEDRRPDEADAALRRALELAGDRVALDSAHAEDQVRLVGTLQGLSWRLIELSRVTEAATAWRRSLAMIEEISSETERSRDLRQKYAEGWFGLGTTFRNAGQYEDAETAYLTALPLADDLERDFPKVPTYAMQVGTVYTMLGSTYVSLDRAEEADQAALKAQEIFGELVADHPNDTGYRERLARSHVVRGNALKRAGQLEGAAHEFERCIEVLEELEDTPWAREESHRRELWAAYNNLGNTLDLNGQHERAVEILR